MRRTIALLLILAVTSTGCAVRSAGTSPAPQPSIASSPGSGTPWLSRAYLEKLPIGGRVKVGLANGDRFDATLLGVTDEALHVQRRTRIPERPIAIPLSELAMVTVPEKSRGGLAASIAAGAVAGLGAAIGFVFFLIAVND
jgi:hypothetical protein